MGQTSTFVRLARWGTGRERPCPPAALLAPAGPARAAGGNRERGGVTAPCEEPQPSPPTAPRYTHERSPNTPSGTPYLVPSLRPPGSLTGGPFGNPTLARGLQPARCRAPHRGSHKALPDGAEGDALLRIPGLTGPLRHRAGQLPIS